MVEAIVAIAIVALLLFLAWKYFFSGPGIAGALPGGGNPTRPLDRWSTAPQEITVGTPATFVFESMNNNPTATSGPQLTPINGRAIGFSVQPAEVTIVSINGAPVNAAVGSGPTVAPNGLVTVVIVANQLPAPPPTEPGEDPGDPQGTIVGIPAAATTTQVTATFTIVQ